MFFKKKKEKLPKRANAILYPDKIVVDTWNNSGGESFIITDNVTVLAITSSESEIAFSIKKHLLDSVFQSVVKEDLMQTRSRYRKKLKVKTEKALFENARCVAVKLDDEIITLNSYKTRSSDKMFTGNPSSIVSFNSDIDDESLGGEIKKAWEKCEIIL